MKLNSTIALLLSLFVAGPHAVRAGDAPAIDRLTPPGGQCGTTVNVSLSGSTGEGPLQFVSTRQQLLIEPADKDGHVSITIPQDTDPGVHLLRFYNQYGSTGLLPFVVGILPEVAEVDTGHDDITTAQPVPAQSAVINGVIARADEVDVYACDVPENATLVASITANRILHSPMDAVLQILDSHGTIVAHNDDDRGLDPLVTLQTESGGRFYVRAFAFPAQPNSTVRLAGAATYQYRLTVSSEAFLDHAQPALVHAADTSNVRVLGWNIPPEFETAQVVPEAAPAFVRVKGPYANTLRLAMTTLPSFVHDNQPGSPLQPDSHVTGCIQGADETDSFLLGAGKGDRLTIRVAARALGSQLDPVLSINDAAGNRILENDDISRTNLDAQANFVAKADGQYTVNVRDRYGSGSQRHFYVLTCERTVPNVSPTIDIDHVALTESSEQKIKVDLNRSNGFSERLVVRATGLPAGVTAEPVTSEASGDSSKTITIQLVRSATAAGFSGSIQIQCVADSGTVFTASVKHDLPHEPITDVWLTVAAAEKGDTATAESPSRSAASPEK